MVYTANAGDYNMLPTFHLLQKPEKCVVVVVVSQGCVCFPHEISVVVLKKKKRGGCWGHGVLCWNREVHCH